MLGCPRLAPVSYIHSRCLTRGQAYQRDTQGQLGSVESDACRVGREVQVHGASEGFVGVTHNALHLPRSPITAG
jgi:hypothetical protein